MTYSNRLCVSVGAVVFSLMMSRKGLAQSTGGLGSYERPVQFQISVGGNAGLIGINYGRQAGPLRAFDASVHIRTASPTTIRADTWVIDRHADAASQVPSYSLRPANSRLTAIVLSGDLPLQVTGDFSFRFIAGAGLEHSRGVLNGDDAGGAPAQTITRSANGYVLSAGLALKWRHVVVEQFVQKLVGPDPSIGNSENAPLTVGLRF